MMENLNQAVSPALQSSGPPPTLRAHVVKMLSAGILSGKYKPGDRLNESQIARELSISRIPVREALSQLQEQGLVQNRERRGMFVTNIGPEEVLQLCSLRIVLESEALRLAQARMTPEIVASLEKLIAQMDAWDGTLLEAAGLDLEFHRILWKAAGNPYLERALNTVMIPLFAYKTLEHVTRDVSRWRLSHHRVLLDAMMGRSGDAPQEVMLTHMRMAYTDMRMPYAAPERYSAPAKKLL
jgi:DNA-binding GntR family transcriptional regulator